MAADWRREGRSKGYPGASLEKVRGGVGLLALSLWEDTFFKVQSPVVPDDTHFFCKNTLNTYYMPARCWESKTDVGPVLQGFELENETGK